MDLAVYGPLLAVVVFWLGYAVGWSDAKRDHRGSDGLTDAQRHKYAEEHRKGAGSPHVGRVWDKRLGRYR